MKLKKVWMLSVFVFLFHMKNFMINIFYFWEKEIYPKSLFHQIKANDSAPNTSYTITDRDVKIVYTIFYHEE